MTNSQKEFYNQFGCDETFLSQQSDELKQYRPARIISEERGRYLLQFDFKTKKWGSVSGKWQYVAQKKSDYPVIGDWVLADAQYEVCVIHFLFKRKSALRRKNDNLIQILAANVDTMFIMTSLNADFNLARLDRYVVFARESRVIPVILLSKSDIWEDCIEGLISEVEQRFSGVRVHTISKNNFSEALFLKDYLRPGSTCVLVGSSGVGKSTLTNFLVGEELMKTQDIREDDGKGRHTTTSKAMVRSFYGGLIIDTPGMRGLTFEASEEVFHQQFSEIEEIISRCRFSNCTHQSEPGCAVKAAYHDGGLEEAQFKNYLKLLKETRYALRKADKALFAEDKKEWKKRSILAREHFKSKTRA